MIGDLLFFIKTIVLTLVVIMLLQIKVGEHTLEQRATTWARKSAVAASLQEVAHGGVLALRDGWRKFYGLFSGEVKNILKSDEAPGNRSLGISFERSKKYFQEKAEKAKQVAQEKSRELADAAKEKAHQTSDELIESFDSNSSESSEE